MSQDLGQTGLERQEMAEVSQEPQEDSISTRTSIEKLTVKSRPTKNGSK